MSKKENANVFISADQAKKNMEKVSKALYELITQPDHYISGRKFEPIDVINDWKVGYNLGNAIKYISRAGRKNSKEEDLKKAIFYIYYEITGKKLSNEQMKILYKKD